MERLASLQGWHLGATHTHTRIMIVQCLPCFRDSQMSSASSILVEGPPSMLNRCARRLELRKVAGKDVVGLPLNLVNSRIMTSESPVLIEFAVVSFAPARPPQSTSAAGLESERLQRNREKRENSVCIFALKGTRLTPHKIDRVLAPYKPTDKPSRTPHLGSAPQRHHECPTCWKDQHYVWLRGTIPRGAAGLCSMGCGE